MRCFLFACQILFVVAGGVSMGACGSARSATRDRAATPAVPSPSGSAIVADVAAHPDEATDAGVSAPVAMPEPMVEAALVRANLTPFTSLAKACSGLLARSASPVLRNERERGSTLASVRTGCRSRPASVKGHADRHHDPRGPSLVEFFRTTAFPRHGDVDTVAAALAFPIGTKEWLVAIEGAEESEGMQSMSLGDASGSVEVASAERVDLVGTDVPEFVFVLSVAEHPNMRMDLVVCDSRGAWCTKPSALDRIFSQRGGDVISKSQATEPRAYAFRRHPRGVLAMTIGEPVMPDRLFPFEGTLAR